MAYDRIVRPPVSSAPAAKSPTEKAAAYARQQQIRAAQRKRAR